MKFVCRCFRLEKVGIGKQNTESHNSPTGQLRAKRPDNDVGFGAVVTDISFGDHITEGHPMLRNPCAVSSKVNQHRRAHHGTDKMRTEPMNATVVLWARTAPFGNGLRRVSSTLRSLIRASNSQPRRVGNTPHGTTGMKNSIQTQLNFRKRSSKRGSNSLRIPCCNAG